MPYKPTTEAVADDEIGRVAALRRYSVVDTGPEPVFDALVSAAAQVAGVPIAMVNLLDDHTLWFKAKVGIDGCSVPRRESICDLVVAGGEELVIGDLSLDERTRDNAHVTGPPNARAYAGFPLRTADGHVIGTLCVVDGRPRQFDESLLAALRALAGQAMVHLELRLSMFREADALRVQDQLIEQLVVAENRWRDLVEFASDVIISRHDLDGTLQYVSPSISTVLGIEPHNAQGRVPQVDVHPDDLPSLAGARRAVASGVAQLVRARVRHADGTWRELDVRLTPRRGADGEVVEMFAAAREPAPAGDPPAVRERSTPGDPEEWEYLTASRQLASGGWALSDTERAHYEPVKGNGTELSQLLDQLGAAGWRLVTQVTDELVFTRPARPIDLDRSHGAVGAPTGRGSVGARATADVEATHVPGQGHQVTFGSLPPSPPGTPGPDEQS